MKKLMKSKLAVLLIAVAIGMSAQQALASQQQQVNEDLLCNWFCNLIGAQCEGARCIPIK